MNQRGEAESFRWLADCMCGFISLRSSFIMSTFHKNCLLHWLHRFFDSISSYMNNNSMVKQKLTDCWIACLSAQSSSSCQTSWKNFRKRNWFKEERKNEVKLKLISRVVETRDVQCSYFVNLPSVFTHSMLQPLLFFNLKYHSNATWSSTMWRSVH